MRFWKPIYEFLRSPEWVAALVLFVQAVILVMQTKILGRHAETMEKHTEIAGTQSETAKSIGNALEQQGKILAAQTKIMEEQFKFQRRLEEKSERVRILDLITSLYMAVTRVSRALGEVSIYTHEEEAKVADKESEMSDLLLRCTKELRSSIHITQAERDYFLGYVRDVNSVPACSRGNFRECLAIMKTLEGKHPEVLKKVFAAAQTPL